MLKNIPDVISPRLLRILSEMGHGNQIVIADGNFPATDIAANTKGGLVEYYGHGVSVLLEAILKLMPLDTYVEKPVVLMAVVKKDQSDKPPDPEIWGKFKEIITASCQDFPGFKKIERDNFYEVAKKAFAVIATSEKAIYANVILTKGLL